MPTLAILYGLNEGPAHARQLWKAAASRGFEISNNPLTADIVIAHSGGCYFLGQATKHQTVLMANPVCGPLSQIPLTLTKKIIHDFLACLRARQLGAWAHKTAWNVVYGFTRFTTNRKMLSLAAEYRSKLPDIRQGRVTVINNQHDPWAFCIPAEAILAHPDYHFISMPGSHDDLWLHPEPYLDLVESVVQS